MKKLLIAMTAVAVGTCAWADGVTLLDQNFDSAPTGWTVGEGGKVSTVADPWSYSGENGAVGDGELTLADGKLSLNTGSKKLTGDFVSNGSSTNIANGLYFNATVTFKDPSDTLPTLGDADKFALVVLDNVESIDAGKATAPATNLWVIAKYGENGQRAYQLDVAVDSTWLASEHEIVVKAYDNVMASGNCAGFLVMVDKIVCTVFQSCAIENNVINFGSFCRGNNFEDGAEYNLGYLGYPKTAILASVQKRYADAQLILSNVPGSDTLASVDFQGQGVIDNVSLAKTTVEEFGSDSLVFTVEGTANGVMITSDTTVYYSAAGETKNITFTLATGWVLKGVAAGLEPDNGVYTYQYTTVAANDQVVKIEAYQPAAYVGTTPYETFSAALAAVANRGTLKLSANVESGIEIASSKNLVLDLNGKTIADIYNEGTLTIMDSSNEENGTVGINAKYNCSVDNYGALTILGGCFDGAILNDGGTVTVSGGKFKVKPADTVLASGLAFSGNADSNGYFSVVTATVTPLPELTIPEDATAEQEKAAVETALGTQADEAVKANITNKTEYAEFKTWAGTVTGGAAAVVASQNAWVAYALDNAGLLDDAKVTLTDNDITVESFGQAENAAAGQFTLEISLKDVTIGAATKANLLKIFEAVGTTDLKAAFTAGAVTTDVVAANGKAKFTVAPSAATKPNAFFFKAQIKK